MPVPQAGDGLDVDGELPGRRAHGQDGQREAVQRRGRDAHHREALGAAGPATPGQQGPPRTGERQGGPLKGARPAEEAACHGAHLGEGPGPGARATAATSVSMDDSIGSGEWNSAMAATLAHR